MLEFLSLTCAANATLTGPNPPDTDSDAPASSSLELDDFCEMDILTSMTVSVNW